MVPSTTPSNNMHHGVIHKEQLQRILNSTSTNQVGAVGGHSIYSDRKRGSGQTDRQTDRQIDRNRELFVYPLTLSLKIIVLHTGTNTPASHTHTRGHPPSGTHACTHT